MSNERATDEHIIKRIINGDIDNYEYIVKRYQNLIFSIGMRFFRNEDDSNDFVQEVFMKAYRELNSYKGKAPFRYWLGKIAYNYGVNSIKSQKKDVTQFDDMCSDEPTPEKTHIRDEIKQILLNAIDQLPEHYRMCLDFYFFHGLSYNEICEITGYPVNTIKSNVFRAKQTLRDVLRGSIAEDYHEM